MSRRGTACQGHRGHSHPLLQVSEARRSSPAPTVRFPDWDDQRWACWQEAYSALLANPVDERKAEALRELLRELCRRGRLATLLSLPLADVVAVPIAGRCVTRLEAEPDPYLAAILALIDSSALRGALLKQGPGTATPQSLHNPRI